MVRAKGMMADGRPLLMMGFDYGELDGLAEDRPITFDLAEYGMVGQVLIVAGRDAKEIEAKAKAKLAVGH